MALSWVGKSKEEYGWRSLLLRFLPRNRFQLGGALLVGVLLPHLIRWPADPLTILFGSQANTLIATFTAIVISYMLIRRLSGYPGTQSLSLIAPILSLTYMAIIGAIFFFRIDYARFQMMASFLLVAAWFFAVAVAEARYRRPRFAILPFGHALELLKSDAAIWTTLTSPNNALGYCSGVVADLRADLPAEWENFLAKSALKGLPVYHSKQVGESLTGRVEIEHLSENNLGSLLPSSVYLRVKRGFDLLALMLVSPVILLISLITAVLIRLDSPGPVFFRQERMGYRGKIFTMIKFRTMLVGADGPDFTIPNDQRITPLGRFLRKYRLDELPQVINILRGDMSWIGPRPEAITLSEQYERKVPFYSYRHIVRPGLTGWAQVRHGHTNGVNEASDKLQYDFYYIKYFSFWLDVLITALTIRTVLTGFESR